MQPHVLGLICAIILALHSATMLTTSRWKPFRNGARNLTRKVLIWIPVAMLMGTVIRAFPIPLNIAVVVLALGFGGLIGSIANRAGRKPQSKV